MDKQVKKELIRVNKGILTFDIVSAILLAIISKFMHWNIPSMVLGVVCGSIVAMINFFLMAKNLENVVEKQKLAAGASYYFGYIVRFVLAGAILVIAAKTKYINIFTTALGLLSTQIVIVTTRTFGKK